MTDTQKNWHTSEHEMLNKIKNNRDKALHSMWKYKIHICALYNCIYMHLDLPVGLLPAFSLFHKTLWEEELF